MEASEEFGARRRRNFLLGIRSRRRRFPIRDTEPEEEFGEGCRRRRRNFERAGGGIFLLGIRGGGGNRGCRQGGVEEIRDVGRKGRRKFAMSAERGGGITGRASWLERGSYALPAPRS